MDKPFRRLLDLTQCPFGPKALTYLRGLPSAMNQNASRTLLTPDPSVGQVWQPTISPSGSFAFERASVRIREVKFLKIPSLAGTVAPPSPALSVATTSPVKLKTPHSHTSSDQPLSMPPSSLLKRSPRFTISTLRTIPPWEAVSTRGIPFSTGPPRGTQILCSRDLEECFGNRLRSVDSACGGFITRSSVGMIERGEYPTAQSFPCSSALSPRRPSCHSPTSC